MAFLSRTGLNEELYLGGTLVLPKTCSSKFTCLVNLSWALKGVGGQDHFLKRLNFFRAVLGSLNSQEEV